MRLLSNLHVKGKPAVLLNHGIRGQSHYFIYRPRICTPAVTWRSFRNHLLNYDYTANIYFGFRYSFVWNLSYSVKNSARCYNKLPVVLLAPSYRRTVATRLEATTWRLAPKTKVPKYLLCQHFWRYYIKVGYSGGILTACVSHCEVCLS